MAELQEILGARSATILVAYAVISLGMLAVLWRLSVQWQRNRVSTAGRLRAALALVLVAGVALLLVTITQRHLQEREAEQRLQAELLERERIALVLQTRLSTEIGAVRAMLAERTVRNIEAETLTKARDELARFATLKDPQIAQMLTLIDTELEIRTLVEQTLAESAPDKLARLYARLAALAPDNQGYRDSAALYAAQAAAPRN